MTAQALTIFSGLILLLVLALVGWTVRRRRRSPERDDTATWRR